MIIIDNNIDNNDNTNTNDDDDDDDNDNDNNDTYYCLREFASANERHLDSSALGRWIPRPERRQTKAKPKQTTQFID